MKIHEFTIVVEGSDLQADANADALFEAGCDDGTIGSVDRVQFLEFTREATSLGEAVDSAIAQIQAAVPATSVVRITRD